MVQERDTLENNKAYQFYEEKNAKIIIIRDPTFLETTEENKILIPIISHNEESSSEEDENEIPIHTILTRYTRVKKAPLVFDDSGLLSDDTIHNEKDPQTCREAIEGNYKEKWTKLMEEEMIAIKENKTWSLTSLPKDRKNPQDPNGCTKLKGIEMERNNDSKLGQWQKGIHKLREWINLILSHHMLKLILSDQSQLQKI